MSAESDGSFRHVDDVGSKTFKRWTKGEPPNEYYGLHRANDLIERAKTVKRGDKLLMISSGENGQPRQLFDIVSVMPVTPDERFNGNKFLVQLQPAETEL